MNHSHIHEYKAQISKCQFLELLIELQAYLMTKAAQRRHKKEVTLTKRYQNKIYVKEVMKKILHNKLKSCIHDFTLVRISAKYSLSVFHY